MGTSILSKVCPGPGLEEAFTRDTDPCTSRRLEIPLVTGRPTQVYLLPSGIRYPDVNASSRYWLQVGLVHLRQKAANICEIQVNGGDIAAKVDFARGLFEQKVDIDAVFSKVSSGKHVHWLVHASLCAGQKSPFVRPKQSMSRPRTSLMLMILQA